MVRVAEELKNRDWRVAAMPVAGAAGADAVRERHVPVVVLAWRGAGVERGDQ